MHNVEGYLSIWPGTLELYRVVQGNAECRMVDDAVDDDSSLALAVQERGLVAWQVVDVAR